MDLPSGPKNGRKLVFWSYGLKCNRIGQNRNLIIDLEFRILGKISIYGHFWARRGLKLIGIHRKVVKNGITTNRIDQSHF